MSQVVCKHRLLPSGISQSNKETLQDFYKAHSIINVNYTLHKYIIRNSYLGMIIKLFISKRHRPYQLCSHYLVAILLRIIIAKEKEKQRQELTNSECEI